MNDANRGFEKLIAAIAENPALFGLLLLLTIIMCIRQAALVMVVHAHISRHGSCRIAPGFWIHLIVTCVLLVLVISVVAR